MAVWNASFEATPAGTENPSFGDDRIRELKSAVRERLEKELFMDLAGGDAATDGWFRAGAAKVYNGSSAPTTRPDGVTALTADDTGRLWRRSTDGVVHVYVHGTGWVDFTNLGLVRSTAYPVGSYYVQYPDAANNTDSVEFPTSQSPATLFGGTWAEQWATESVYFRTRGTLSDSGRVAGKQEDALQGFRLQNVAQTGYRTSAGGGGNAYALGDVPNYNTPLVTDTVNGTPRVASETRTVNRRIKVWKRTA